MVHALLFSLILFGATFSANRIYAQAAQICGTRGYDLATSTYDETKGASLSTLANCGARCVTDPKCLSFAFGSNQCLLYLVAVDGNLERDTESPYRFYDRSCVGNSTSTSTSSPTRSSTPTRSPTSTRSPTPTPTSLTPTPTPTPTTSTRSTPLTSSTSSSSSLTSSSSTPTSSSTSSTRSIPSSTVTTTSSTAASSTSSNTPSATSSPTSSFTSTIISSTSSTAASSTSSTAASSTSSTAASSTSSTAASSTPTTLSTSTTVSTTSSFTPPIIPTPSTSTSLTSSSTFISSRPTSSTPTSSRPTSASPTSSRPTSSTPTSSRPTSSAPTSSTPTTITSISSTRTSSAPTTTSSIPASPYICGLLGYERDLTPYETMTASSMNVCSNYCHKSSGCMSFSFGTNTCMLYPAPVAGNFDRDTSSPYRFFDSKCPIGLSSTSGSISGLGITYGFTTSPPTGGSRAPTAASTTRSATSTSISSGGTLNPTEASPSFSASGFPEQSSSTASFGNASATSASPSTSSSSAPLLCGVGGWSAATTIFYDSSGNFGNRTACELRCKAISCGSYGIGSKSCLVYSGSVSQSVILDSRSSYEFFDAGCSPVTVRAVRRRRARFDGR